MIRRALSTLVILIVFGFSAAATIDTGSNPRPAAAAPQNPTQGVERHGSVDRAPTPRPASPATIPDPCPEPPREGAPGEAESI